MGRKMVGPEWAALPATHLPLTCRLTCAPRHRNVAPVEQPPPRSDPRPKKRVAQSEQGNRSDHPAAVEIRSDKTPSTGAAPNNREEGRGNSTDATQLGLHRRQPSSERNMT